MVTRLTSNSWTCVFFDFSDPEKEAEYQTATTLAKNLLRKHGLPTDRGTKKK